MQKKKKKRFMRWSKEGCPRTLLIFKMIGLRVEAIQVGNMLRDMVSR
jgi:hypothetical protein